MFATFPMLWCNWKYASRNKINEYIIHASEMRWEGKSLWTEFLSNRCVVLCSTWDGYICGGVCHCADNRKILSVGYRCWKCIKLNLKVMLRVCITVQYWDPVDHKTPYKVASVSLFKWQPRLLARSLNLLQQNESMPISNLAKKEEHKS